MPKVDKCGQRGREGVKNGTFVRTSFMDGPYALCRYETAKVRILCVYCTGWNRMQKYVIAVYNSCSLFHS